METVRRYLGLGGELDSAGGNTIPVLVVALILLATYNVLDRPWWQEMLVATAGTVSYTHLTLPTILLV